MQVEIWSDVVCPWCYLGKRRFESALSRFEHADGVEVVWRSFELDPGAPRRREGTAAEHLAAKYGMSPEEVEASWARLTGLARAEGLEYHLDRTQGGSSFDAHRLIQLGRERGLQDAVKERILRAYFTESLPIGEPDVLARLAAEAGLAEDEAIDLLAGDAFADAVRADERRAAELGIGGVPFFVVDDRYAVSGAQSTEHFLQALTVAWDSRAA
ncbi:MAG TPA: DsbA family oxidoreductase [Gaiellaceae bacterium]|nr:DsbA family oxidoreductase [Gaiellaceae bacterium]